MRFSLFVFFLIPQLYLFQFFLCVGKFILDNEIKIDLDLLRPVWLVAFRRIHNNLINQFPHHWTCQFFNTLIFPDQLYKPIRVDGLLLHILRLFLQLGNGRLLTAKCRK